MRRLTEGMIGAQAVVLVALDHWPHLTPVDCPEPHIPAVVLRLILYFPAILSQFKNLCGNLESETEH